MDLERLLCPLDPQHPCGPDMSFSPEFDRIQEARRSDDPQLNQGEWVAPIKEADWSAVVSGCAVLLEYRTKDLRVAAWLVEGLAHTEGVAGLALGYRCFARLCERFQAGIHPLPDDGDPSSRVGCLAWLLTQSVRIARELPLTDPLREGYSSLDLEAARTLATALERDPAEAAARQAAAPVTLAQFDAACEETAPAFYRDSLAAAADALATLNELERIVASWLGDEAPGFTPAREAFEGLIDTLRRLAGDVAESAQPLAKDRSDRAEAGERAPCASDRPGLATVGSRAQAIAQLRQVAAFFRRTEPHSPVAYLADKAARWGEMPLHEWLRAVVKDDGTLARVEDLLGVDEGSVTRSGEAGA